MARKFLLQIGVIIIVNTLTSTAYSSSYRYEQQKIHNQVIHIVMLDPSEYQIQLVRANNGYGRESVPAIAKRTGADIAINGGFFDMSLNPNQDGLPSGTLIIKGHIYQKKNQVQSLLVIKDNKLVIMRSNPAKQISKNVSMVSGIPLLIEHGKIPTTLSKKVGDFYNMPHARTALGVKADGSVVIVVAEYHYQVDLTNIVLGNAEETASKQNKQGLTILNLARLMKTLGCQYAINLDGGGSSTLYMNGKVVNQTIGDIDEDNGLHAVRAVSDAIIFKQR